MSDKISIVARLHPFTSEKTVSEIDPGDSVEGIIRALSIRTGNAIVKVDGEQVEREKWPETFPGAGSLVTVQAVPAGGSGDPGRDVTNKGVIGGTLLMFAGTIMLATPLAGIGLYLIGTGFALVAGGIAGGYLIDELMPDSDGLNSKTSLSIRGGSNTLPSQGTPVPVVFGKHLVVPYYGAKPYTSISGDDGETQYLTQLFCLGVGPLRVTDIKIGENLLASNSAHVRNGEVSIDGNYSDVSMQIYQDGSNPSLYPYCVLEDQPNIELSYGVEHWLTTAKNVDKISVDITFPSGLYKYDDGEKEAHVCFVVAKIRAVGSDTSWDLCETINTFVILKVKAKTLRYTAEYTPAIPGQYEVGLMRTTFDDGDNFSGASSVHWTNFRSIRTSTPPVDSSVRGDYVFLALRIKATKQLSGVVSQLNCVCEAEIPDYAGTGSGPSAWAGGFTLNPASAFLWALRGPLNPRPIPDALVDWASLEAWWTTCNTKGWTCNAVVSSSARLQDLLNQIGSTGRAQMTVRDGLYSVVVDEAKTTIVEHFTPRNVRNFAWTKAFAELPKGLLVSFISEEDGWASNERTVPYDEYTEAEAEDSLEEISMWGVTDPALAYKHARHRLAVSRLRPEMFTFETDAEGLVCEVGDLVLVSHDAILAGLYSGRVKGLVTNTSGQVTGIVADELITTALGGSYGVRFWRGAKSDSVYRAVENPGTASANTISFTTPLEASDAPAVDDLFTFGESGIETARCIVAGYEPVEDFGVRFYVVDEAPGVHTADSGTIPAFDSKVSRPPQTGTAATSTEEQIADAKSAALEAVTAVADTRPTYTEIAQGFTAAGKVVVPVQLSMSAAGGFRAITVSWSKQASLSNLLEYQLQCSENALTWYAPLFDGTGTNGHGDVAGGCFSTTLTTIVHPNIPPVLDAGGNGTGRLLYYRVRQRTALDAYSEWSPITAATTSLADTGDYAANSISANALKVSELYALFATLSSTLIIDPNAGLAAQNANYTEGDTRAKMDALALVFQYVLSGNWETIVKLSLEGLMATQVYSESHLFLTNANMAKRRAAGFDIGRPYLSSASRVLHYDSDFLDHTGAEYFTMAGSGALVGKDDGIAPAIVAKAPYATEGRSLYGNFKLVKNLGTASQFTVDLWLMLTSSESHVPIRVGSAYSNVALEVLAGESLYSIPTAGECAYSIPAAGECAYSAPAGQITQIVKTLNSIRTASAVNLDAKVWYHIGIIDTGSALSFRIQDSIIPLSSIVTDGEVTVTVNENLKVLAVDEVLIDPTTAETAAQFAEGTVSKVPWAALSDANDYLVIQAEDPAYIKTNLFDSPAFTAKVQAIIDAQP